MYLRTVSVGGGKTSRDANLLHQFYPPHPDSKKAKGAGQMKCMAFSDMASITGDERAKLVFRLTLLCFWFRT